MKVKAQDNSKISKKEPQFNNFIFKLRNVINL